MSDREKLIELLTPQMSGSPCIEESGSCEFTNCRECNARYLADYLIANGVTVQKWIPVSERLPIYGERVLTTDGCCIFEAYLSFGHKWKRREGLWWEEGAVTHWMPLPEPPKECE